MPEQPPAPIQIRIDTQEQRSGIPDLLATMPQVHIEVMPLRMGDYDVGGDPCRVFERKTGSDFLSSLAQGRLFAQLTALRKSRFAPILLLEGDQLRVDRSEMRPESIRGRSPTSRLSCACRSCQAAGRRIPRTWSMLRQNSARSGTRLAALRRGGPGLLCPSSRCRLCWPCHRARYAHGLAACMTC
jgi:hypothetical protein